MGRETKFKGVGRESEGSKEGSGSIKREAGKERMELEREL